MGKIYAVCSSSEKGTPKTNIQEGFLKKDYGLEGDIHAGKGNRQGKKKSASKRKKKI